MLTGFETMGEVWRWLRSRMLRRPVGQPMAVSRELVAELRPGKQEFPRVPPAFMTASEHAYWLKCEAAKVEPAPLMLDTRQVGLQQDAWAAEQVRGRLVWARPEMNAYLAAQRRNAQGSGEVDELTARIRRAAQAGPTRGHYECGAPNGINWDVWDFHTP